MPKLKWMDLICKERFYLDGPAPISISTNPISEMQNDVTAILNSSAFRRMQRKAQVYIAPDNDFVRNRLTHTLEVAEVARMLSSLVFIELDKNAARLVEGDNKYVDDEFSAALPTKGGRGVRKRDLTESIAAAAYMHDIGNPPFGHVGEFAISSWFEDHARKGDSVDAFYKCNARQGNMDEADFFTHFDGNPQGFRIVTRLLGWKELGGLELTYTTLATSMKYPWGAGEGTDNHSKKEKYGFFETERTTAKKIFEKMNLVDGKKLIRHPFSYLMEAADDIAYCLSDVEDGWKSGLIDFNIALDALGDLARPRLKHSRYEEMLKKRQDTVLNSDKIKFLRMTATHNLIYLCKQTFLDNLQGVLMEGNPLLKIAADGSEKLAGLIDMCELSSQVEAARTLSRKYVYSSPQKVLNEQGAYQTVRQLLEIYSSAIEKFHREKSSADSRTKNLIANLYRVYEDVSDENVRWQSIVEKSPLLHYRALVDLISGMTDHRAIQVLSKLQGLSINSK
jgi:dGTPase